MPLTNIDKLDDERLGVNYTDGEASRQRWMVIRVTCVNTLSNKDFGAVGKYMS